MNGGIPSCSVGSCSNRFIRDSKGCAFKRVWSYRNYGAERRFSRSLLSNCVASSSIRWSSSRTSNRSFLSDSIDCSSVGWSSSRISSIEITAKNVRQWSVNSTCSAWIDWSLAKLLQTEGRHAGSLSFGSYKDLNSVCRVQVYGPDKAKSPRSWGKGCSSGWQRYSFVYHDWEKSK